MKKYWITLLLVCVAAVSANAAQTILLLRSSVKVTTADVLLEDIVSEEVVMPAEWKERRVFSAPPVGEVSYFSLTTVAHALNRYYDMQNVVIRGEPVITVQREDRKLEKDEFKQPLLDYLSDHSPWDGLDLQVEILSIPDDTRIPVGKTEFEIKQIDEKTARGYSQAHVMIRVNDQDIKEISIGIEIQSLTDVWVVRKNLTPGHLLSPNDLRSEKRVVNATEGYVASSEDLEGYEVTSALSAGGLLRRNAVSKPVCVRRGDWVAINAFGANLHITLRGKALANGRLGERILCVNERSQRQVLVELVGAGNGVLVRM